MKRILLGGAVALATLFGTAQNAEAGYNDYCREYTKTVRVGGRLENAYGTACLQPDGSWKIVSERNNSRNRYYNDRHYDEVRYVIHDRGTRVRPRHMYYNPVFWGSGSSFYFSFSDNDHNHWKHDRHYKKKYVKHHHGHHKKHRGKKHRGRRH